MSGLGVGSGRVGCLASGPERGWGGGLPQRSGARAGSSQRRGESVGVQKEWKGERAGVVKGLDVKNVVY